MFRFNTSLKILFGMIYTDFKNILTRKKKKTREKKKTYAVGFQPTTPRLTVLSSTTGVLAPMTNQLHVIYIKSQRCLRRFVKCQLVFRQCDNVIFPLLCVTRLLLLLFVELFSLVHL